MKFVYQTKLSGTIDLPIVKSYTRFCLIMALLTKGKNLLKGEFIENEFKDMLQALKTLGVKLYKRDNGIVVDAPEDNKAPFESLFEEEIKYLKENYGENIFSEDYVMVKDEETVSKIFCLILGNIVYENSCSLVLPKAADTYKDIDIAIAAIVAFGGEVDIKDNREIKIFRSVLNTDLEIEPATDMRIGSFALMCSTISENVKCRNYYQDSALSGFYELVLSLSEFGVVLKRNDDGEVYFEKADTLSSVKIDCEKAGKFLPYLVFFATTAKVETEFFNCSKAVVERDGGALYYTISELNKLGANISPKRRSTFVVNGGTQFAGGVDINCHENLTVFFISVLATLYSEKANSFENIEIINRYIGFWNLFKNIGGYAEDI